MAKSNGDRRHLLQQNQAWYARVAVPLDLQRLFRQHPETRPAGIGKHEVVVALKTRDLRTAQARRWPVVAAVQTRFDELRARYHQNGDDTGRRAFQLTLERLQGEAARGDWPESSREELYDRLDDAVRDHRGRGEFGGGPGTPVFDAHAAFLNVGTTDTSKYAPPITEIAARYLKDRARDADARVTAQTTAQERAVLDLFAAWHRGGLAKVTDQVATAFLDTISGLDPLWARSPGKRAATLAALQARSLSAHEEGLSNRTINRYTSTMSAFMEWASKRYPGIDKAAFAGNWRKPSGTRKTGWLPMTDTEVLTIIDHVDQLPHDAPMFWLPRVGAYSGMRLNEICSLKVADVIQRDGLTCFSITGAKTAAGDRVVPVHSAVLQAGLLAYVSGLPADGQLFPTLTPGGPDGKLSWTMTQEFTRLRRRLGINRDRVSFHSLRKSFTTKLELAHVPPTEAAQLLGHERGFTFTTYSSGLRPAHLKELVEKVRYALT